MADKKDDKKDAKPSIDYAKLNKELNEHGKGKHVNDITERLLSTYLNQKAKIYKAKGIDDDDDVQREFKMTVEEAESMADSLYDTLVKYAAIKHNKLPKSIRDELAKIKGDHGISPLEALAESAFGTKRHEIRDKMKLKADAGETFTEEDIKEMFKQSLNIYHAQRQDHIIRNKYKIGSEHLDDLKKQSESLIEKHGLNKGNYMRYLKSKNFEDQYKLYTQLASNYYRPAEEKKK